MYHDEQVMLDIVPEHLCTAVQSGTVDSFLRKNNECDARKARARQDLNIEGKI